MKAFATCFGRISQLSFIVYNFDNYVAYLWAKMRSFLNSIPELFAIINIPYKVIIVVQPAASFYQIVKYVSIVFTFAMIICRFCLKEFFILVHSSNE